MYERTARLLGTQNIFPNEKCIISSVTVVKMKIMTLCFHQFLCEGINLRTFFGSSFVLCNIAKFDNLSKTRTSNLFLNLESVL